MKIVIVSAARTEPTLVTRNLGDAFLTAQLATFLRSLAHDVRIADFGAPTASTRSINSLTGLARAIRDADLVLIGGGTLIQDNDPTRPFAGLPRLCLVTATLCRIFRTAYGYVGVGVDPIARSTVRRSYAATLRGARFVIVRDEHSRARAQRIARVDVSVGCDAALLASPPREDVGRDGYTVLALNRSEVALLQDGAMLCRLAEHYGPIVLLSMDQSAEWDFSALQGLPLPDGVRLLDPGLSASGAWSCIAGANTVIASRMHALYLAALAGKPSIAVASSSKIAAFVDEFDVPIVDLAHIAGGGDIARRADVDRLAQAASRGRACLVRELDAVMRAQDDASRVA